MKRGRKPITITDEVKDRLETVRMTASGQIKQPSHNDQEPLDPLEVIAWNAGVRAGANDSLNEAVKKARAAGLSWPEIAVAMGESGDAASANRIKNRFFHR